MRPLPCDSPKCRGLGAADGKGRPRLSGRYVREVTCGRCKGLTILEAARWAKLPEATLEQIKAAGIDATTDLRGVLGQDVSKTQAEDFFRAGFRTAQDVLEIPPPPVAEDHGEPA